ncbi:hypothetical protein SLITO_v1c04500 [Spiroplasma litorale]|uniref:Lipoprotein n=1 Tax=Spiroplasma litorale TaxID=216942 RepID=A0A0K1W1Q4_9MOLU|nr:lipoprotein [Spiroplasma litorale]AKX34103.1 hypothetical protein SLITO_v1c04500 [Spiroplasma litorale]
MKKLITILSTIGLTSTLTTNIISCGTDSNNTINGEENIGGSTTPPGGGEQIPPSP